MKDYKKTIENIIKKLEAFKTAKEWSDFISLLTALDKPLKNLPTTFDLDLFPKNLIYKRLNQCLNPALPSGVHNKVIQTYSIIVDKFNNLINAQIDDVHVTLCSDALFNTIMVGFFTFSSYTKIQTKHLYLDLIDQHLFKLKINFNLYVRNIFLGLLPGLQEDSEISSKTNLVILKLMTLTNKNIFWYHFWEVFLLVAEQRQSIINFFNKNEAVIKQLKQENELINIKEIEKMEEDNTSKIDAIKIDDTSKIDDTNKIDTNKNDDTNKIVDTNKIDDTSKINDRDIIVQDFGNENHENNHTKKTENQNIDSKSNINDTIYKNTDFNIRKNVNKTCFYFLDEQFLIFAIKSGLSDKKIIVIRDTLDLIKTILPLEDLSYSCKIDLIESMAYLYTYRDVGLNKRIDFILDSDESNKRKVQKRLEKHKIDKKFIHKKMINYDYLSVALERYIKKDLTTFYKILTVLNDKIDVCDYIAENLIVKSMFEIYNKKETSEYESIKNNFNNYLANTDIWFIWFCLFKSFNDACANHLNESSNKRENEDVRICIENNSDNINDKMNDCVNEKINDEMNNKMNDIVNNSVNDIVNDSVIDIVNNSVDDNLIDIVNNSVIDSVNENVNVVENNSFSCTKKNVVENDFKTNVKKYNDSTNEYKNGIRVCDSCNFNTNDFIDVVLFSIQNLNILENDILEIHLPFFIILVFQNHAKVCLKRIVKLSKLCFGKISIENSNEKIELHILIEKIKEFYDTEQTSDVYIVLNSFCNGIASKIIQMCNNEEYFVLNSKLLHVFIKNFGFTSISYTFFISYYEMLVKYLNKYESDDKILQNTNENHINSVQNGTTYNFCNSLLDNFYFYMDHIKDSTEFENIVHKSYYLYLFLINTQNHIFLQSFNTLFNRKFESFMICDIKTQKNMKNIYHFLTIVICDSKAFYFYSVFISITNFFMVQSNEILYTTNLYDRTDFIAFIDSLHSFDNLFGFILFCMVKQSSISKILTAFTLLQALLNYSSQFILYLKTNILRLNFTLRDFYEGINEDEQNITLECFCNNTNDTSNVDSDKKIDGNNNDLVSDKCKLLLATKLYALITVDSYEIQFRSLEIINRLFEMGVLQEKDLLKIDNTKTMNFLTQNTNKDIFFSFLQTLQILSNLENETTTNKVIDLLKSLNLEDFSISIVLNFIFRLKNINMRKALTIHIFEKYKNIEYNEKILDNVFENRSLYNDDEVRGFVEIITERLEKESHKAFSDIKTTKFIYEAKKLKKTIHIINNKILDNEPKFYIEKILKMNPNSVFLRNCKNYEKIHLLILLQQKIDFGFLMLFENNYNENEIYKLIKNSETVLTNIASMPRNKIYNHEPLQWFLIACLKNKQVREIKPLAFVKIIENSVFLLQKCTDHTIKRFRTLDERNQIASDFFVCLNRIVVDLQDMEYRNIIQTYFVCIFNVLKSKNVHLYANVLQNYAFLSEIAFFDKFWHKSFIELFNDARFFSESVQNMNYKIKITKNYICKNIGRITDYLSKIESSFFVSKDAEVSMKTNTIRRLAFLYFCSEKNMLNAYLNTIFERLVEYLTSNVLEVKKDAIMLSKIIIYKTDVERLYIFWPTFFAEISKIIDSFVAAKEINFNDECLLSEVFKALEIIFVMKIDQVIELKWKYISPYMCENMCSKTIFRKIKDKININVSNADVEMPKTRIPLFRKRNFENIDDLQVFVSKIEDYYKKLDLFVNKIDENEIMSLLRYDFADDEP